MTPRRQALRAVLFTTSYDVATASFSMAAAMILRSRLVSDEPLFPLESLLLASALFGLSSAAAFVIVGVHRQVWRHLGWPDVVRIVQAAILSVLLFLPIMFVSNRLLGVPRSGLPIALVLWLGLLFAGRMVALLRTTRRPFQIFAPVSKSAERAVLVGDATSVVDAMNELRRSRGGAPLNVLGLLLTEGAQPGRAIRGVTVMGGAGDLGDVLDVLKERYQDTPLVAVTGRARRPRHMTHILELAAQRQAKVMALGTSEEGSRLLPVRPADLLSRRERKLDPAPVEALIGNANVFVTGAGGTIGSGLARQCAALKPSCLTLFDASERNLYEIDRELRAAFPNLRIITRLGDVRSLPRLAAAMEEARPKVVLHAAALKHVPMSEDNPCEATLTNIRGLTSAARAASECGAERFVFISTDKAVNPPNVMGGTKRLAELALDQIAHERGMSASMVRFGNVLGSSGSVVPLFERQIETGGPVTVTHPEMTRYFMTVEEATRLVLQAAALHGAPGRAGLFVLDMGKPVSIAALAESMIRLKGFVPDRDVKIDFIGLRAGEKLHEELYYAHERLETTDAEGVLRVSAHAPPGDMFMAELERLLDLADAGDRDGVRARLARMVAAYSAPTPTDLKSLAG